MGRKEKSPAGAEEEMRYDEEMIVPGESGFGAFLPEEENVAADSSNLEEEGKDASLPDEDNASRTEERVVVVPDIQDMDHFVLQYYRTRLISSINEMLVTGQLSELFETPIFTETVGRDDCFFTNMAYWRLDREHFLADIDVQVTLKAEQNGRKVEQEFCFFLSLMVDSDLEFTFYESGLSSDRPERDFRKLDRYLIPILRTDEMEQDAELTLGEKLPGSLEDATLRNPWQLAEAYGLQVIQLRLARKKETHSILFFRDSVVLVQDEKDPASDEVPPPREVSVPANTVVLNLQAHLIDGGMVDLFHECVHYDWHYLFFCLQEAHNSDLRAFKTRKIVVRGEKMPANPLRFMEAQAHRASYALMMPFSIMKRKVYEEYQRASAHRRTGDYIKHDGWKYDCVARSIADDFNLRKYLVRARLIMLGYLAAKGALNYVDGRYIMPFAFSDSWADTSRNTYVIDRKGIASLYQSSREFRRLMSDGDYVYADGHVCLNNPEFLRESRDGIFLTPWANAHVDCCCLRFQVIYIQARQRRYNFGAMNSDEAYDRHYNEYLDRSLSRTSKERLAARNRLMSHMPLSFHECLAYLMENHDGKKMTCARLASLSSLSERTISRLRNEESPSYRLDVVIALCVGLHLPPWLSAELLKRAHLSVERYGELGYYGEILDCFFMDSIRDIQKFLVDNGYPALRLNDGEWKGE